MMLGLKGFRLLLEAKVKVSFQVKIPFQHFGCG